MTPSAQTGQGTHVPAAGVCRLAVYAPQRRMDLAVPVDVVVADLLPVLLNHLGEDLADNGLGHGGWVLQRLGGPPFDEDSTVSSLALHDGDEVHLRPRADQLPPADFDDLIDGVASATRDRAGRWRPAMTRWAATALLWLVLGVGLAVLVLPGRSDQRAAVAGGVAVACLVAAAGVSRIAGLRATATALLAGAAGYAALAGLVAPNPPDRPTGLLWANPQIFTAAVAVAAVGLLAFVVLPALRPLCVAILTAGVLVALAGGLGTAFEWSLPQAGGVLLGAATLGLTVVPLLAFRLSGLRLAPLPTAPEHLQEDLDPVPSTQVLDRAATADRYMTGLYGGLAVPTALALVVTGTAGGWPAPVLSTLAALTLVLAARPMTSGWHRLALLGAAAVGLAAGTVHLAGGQPLARLLVPTVGVALGGVVSVLIARYAPGRRLMPYWGRIGDLLYTAVAIAQVPVLLALLDVYGFARAIGG
ncbi:type VII secretion integral membrane protein EccD [Virgisporangium aurantiacum]|uniref:Type VII secretion integral membrane protein EccD n=1 Tax=Virgisporangium aurantiacum TaxID=175570 RepID=A0A8J4E849_9ACTN|nr:type VII secretion integral membrane protein EccD [Virgisporangium aurantiacum]GIJ62442.1 type VII secretion integral membrane protein EccD [Virgisporangium aurantiacum]